MRKINNLALTFLTVIMCVVSSITSFAMYDDGSYDFIPEDDIPIVDNKIHPNATCQVSFYVLYPDSEFKEGKFEYTMDYYENGEAHSISFQNRWENAKQLETKVGNGTIMFYRFQLEPGEYSFTNDLFTEGGFHVLTPDLKIPDYITINAKTLEEYNAQLANINKFKTQVNSSFSLYAIYGNQEFVDTNKAEFEEYAKKSAAEDANYSGDVLNDINIEDYNSLDELINALREAGCTEEQIEMARATYADAYGGVNDEAVETETTTVEEQQAETEGEESGISPSMPIIVIVLILVIICGIYVFVKKKG